MRVGPIAGTSGFLFFVGLFLMLFSSCAPASPAWERYVSEQEHYAQLFENKDTNCPLLAFGWIESRRVSTRRVDSSGRVGQPGSRDLNASEIQIVAKLIDSLPPTRDSVPEERQILLGCVQSNQWFRAIYDRQEIPAPLEKLTEMMGRPVPWSVSTIVGDSFARADHANFLCVAQDAPIAVASGQGYLQVWNLNKSSASPGPIIKSRFGGMYLAEYQTPAALSPDGSVFAVANDYALAVFDCKKESLIWQTGPLEQEEYMGKHLAIGDGGKTLFGAGGHTIERWDVATGKVHGTLVENPITSQGVVRFLHVSRNGKVLIAGFGLDRNSRPSSFAIWETGKDEPALRFTEKEGATADLSPDGETVVLSAFGRHKIVSFKWKTGERTEIPLRTSSGASSAYSIQWSPDATRIAAYVDDYPASVFVYDATSWKPIGHWECGQIGEGSYFTFNRNGLLYQIRKNELNGLDVMTVK